MQNVLIGYNELVQINLEETLKGKVIVRDLKNDEFSHHTTVEGIFNACANEFKKDLNENEIEIWNEDFSSYSILDKKNFVEIFFDYRVEEPTIELIDEWEVYYDTAFKSKRKREKEINLEM